MRQFLSLGLFAGAGIMGLMSPQVLESIPRAETAAAWTQLAVISHSLAEVG
jgi:hypothetical protein